MLYNVQKTYLDLIQQAEELLSEGNTTEVPEESVLQELAVIEKKLETNAESFVWQAEQGYKTIRNLLAESEAIKKEQARLGLLLKRKANTIEFIEKLIIRAMQTMNVSNVNCTIGKLTTRKSSSINETQLKEDLKDLPNQLVSVETAKVLLDTINKHELREALSVKVSVNLSKTEAKQVLAKNNVEALGGVELEHKVNLVLK